MLPKLVTFQQTGLVRLNFDGGGVSTMQLWGVLQSDALFAIGSVGFIISYLTMHVALQSHFSDENDGNLWKPMEIHQEMPENIAFSIFFDGFRSIFLRVR